MAAQHACTYHSKVLTASKSKGIDLKTWLIRLHLQQFAISLLRSLMHLRADVCLLGAECFWLPQLGGQGFCFAEQFPFQNSFEILSRNICLCIAFLSFLSYCFSVPASPSLLKGTLSAMKFHLSNGQLGSSKAVSQRDLEKTPISNLLRRSGVPAKCGESFSLTWESTAYQHHWLNTSEPEKKKETCS